MLNKNVSHRLQCIEFRAFFCPYSRPVNPLLVDEFQQEAFLTKCFSSMHQFQEFVEYLQKRELKQSDKQTT